MDSTEVDDSSRVVPFKDLKKDGITRILYTHSSCPGLTCSLTCASLGPYVMVHGVSFCTCWLYVVFLITFGWCKAAFTQQTQVGKLVLANPSWCA